MAGAGISTLWRAVFVMSFIWGWYCSMAEQGTATYYTAPYVPSACYGNDPNQFPAGDLFAAASDTIWGNGAACGKQYRITCTGATNQGVLMPCKSGSIVVKIVDYCPAGCAGTFDLSQAAFADIADPDAGKVYIDYEQA
ncbi:EG45-like domain containing protein [Cryptomeria japonica]|uniref:EG45-like domain containing protein n=1 Tax=Cryptomeria japonica TaxID=3369 RepID=UPI0025ABAB3A|nr:EG45-like domain containing protein [Cryptomeria japonica]